MRLHLFWILLLLFEKLTERKGKIDRKRKEADSGQAPTGGSPDERSRKGTKGPDAAIDPRGSYFGEGLSPCYGDGSDETRRCFTRAFFLTRVGAFWGTGALRFLFPRRAHLLTTCPLGRRWYCRDASDARSARRIALSSESARQCRRACGPRSPLSALRERYTSPSACENLHPAALSHRQAIPKAWPAFSFAKEKQKKESR